MSDFSSLLLRKDVQAYSTGAAIDAMSSIGVANFIAPRCPVPGPLFQYMGYDKAKLFKIPDFKRALNGRATQLDLGGTPVNGRLNSYAYDWPVDEHVLKGAEAGMLQFIKNKSRTVAGIGALAWSIEVIDAMYVATGAGTDTNVSSASFDIVGAIDEEIENVAKASMCAGMCPMKVLFGPTAWRLLKNHPTVRGRFLAGGKKKTDTPTDTDVIEMFLTNPQIKVGYISTNTAPEGATATPAWKLSNSVVIFGSNDSPTEEDPSFMKTFHLPGDGIQQLDSYKRDDGRVTVLKVDQQTLAAVTNSTAAVRLNLTES